MEANNSFFIDGPRDVTIKDAGEAAPSPPTPEEISRLTFAKLRELRIHAQGLRNQFAGSPEPADRGRSNEGIRTDELCCFG